MTKEVYDRTLGQDPDLRLGDDTEIAYQLWQRGAVFIPVQSALTYHLGRATVQDKAEEVSYYNGPHFAERMPIPRYRRRATNRQWKVPFVTAVVSVDRETAPYVRECVDMLLTQSVSDLHVLVVGPWSSLATGRRRVLADPDFELHLTQEWFRHEGRVTLVDDDPGDVFPSPYRLDVPVTVGLPSAALSKMIRDAFRDDIGLVNFFPPPGFDVSEAVRLTFTAAHSRAMRYVSDDVTYVEAMDAVWGSGVAAQPGSGAGRPPHRRARRPDQAARPDPGGAAARAARAGQREGAGGPGRGARPPGSAHHEPAGDARRRRTEATRRPCRARGQAAARLVARPDAAAQASTSFTPRFMWPMLRPSNDRPERSSRSMNALCSWRSHPG